MEKTGKKKKGNTKANNNNKLCNNTKCPTKQQRLQIVKHFDAPCKKCKRSSVQDDFPEVSVREAEGSFEKPKRPKLRKRSSQSNSSDGSVRKFSKQNSNAKSYLNKVEVEKPPVPLKDTKVSLVSTTSSTSSVKNVPSETKKIPDQTTASPNDGQFQSCCAELVRALQQAPNSGNIKMSMKDMRNRLQERLTKDIRTSCCNRSGETCGSPTRRMPSCRENREFSVQQLRKEIACSRPIYSCEIKKTVTELKSEIAKYRETLNKNVNLLQERLGPNFFQKAGTPRQSTGVSPRQSATGPQESTRGIPAKKSLSAHSNVLVQTDVSGAVTTVNRSVDKTKSGDSARLSGRSVNSFRAMNSSTKQPVGKGYCCPPTCLVQPADAYVKPRISSMPSLVTEVIPEVTEDETVTDTDGIASEVEPSKADEEDTTIEVSETEIATEGLTSDSPTLSPKISVSEKSSEKIDRAIANPSGSLQSVEFDYLQRQKESIDKVDQLIEEAEHSLQELRREFYQTEEEVKKGGSRTSTAKRSVKSERTSAIQAARVASRGTTEKQSVKSSRVSTQPADQLGSKQFSARSSVKTDRTSIIEQPIGPTVNLTISKDTGRRSIKSEHASFVSTTVSKGMAEKRSSRSVSPSTHQQSMDGPVSAQVSVGSAGKRSVKIEQPSNVTVQISVSKPPTTRTSVFSDHPTITQSAEVGKDALGSNATVSRKSVKSDPTPFAQRLIESAANMAALKDSPRKSPFQFVPESVSGTASTAASKDSKNIVNKTPVQSIHASSAQQPIDATLSGFTPKSSSKMSSVQSAPQSAGFSATVSKDTAGARSMRSNITSSSQQSSTIKESIKSLVPDKPSTISKTSSSKAPTISEYPSVQRQRMSTDSKESGGRKSSVSDRVSVQHGIATDITASKASTLASAQRTPRSFTTDVTTSNANTVASELTGATVPPDKNSFDHSLQEQPMRFPTSASMSTDQGFVGSTAHASTVNDKSSRSIAGSGGEDVPSARLSKTSRKSTDSRKSSRASSKKRQKYDATSNDSDNAQVSDVYIDDSVQIKVYSTEETTQDNEPRHSRFSILKRSVDYGAEDEPKEVIIPTPVDETRFLSTKNSIFLKMFSPSELSNEELEPVDAGSRIVKIAENPSLGEFHTSSSIILQAEELNKALAAAVEKEDSVSNITSTSKQRRVSNVNSDVGLVSPSAEIAEITEQHLDDRKHGSECCPCDKNNKHGEPDDQKITSKKSSRSSGKESDAPKKGSVSAKPSLEPIPDLVEKSSTSGKSGDSSKTPERASEYSRESSDHSLPTSVEPVVDEELEKESLTSSIKTPTSSERAERGSKTSREKSWESMKKSLDQVRSRSSGKSAATPTSVQEDIESKKSDKSNGRKSRDRSYIKKTSVKTQNEKNDVFNKCSKDIDTLGDERIICDRTICRDKSCGPSKKGVSPVKGSPTRSPQAKSHVIPCHVPCRGEVYMQSLPPKSLRELKPKQVAKTRKKKTSGDRSRELGSARKRSDEKFDGDDEDTSVDERSSKRNKTSPNCKLKECCLSDNHQACCPCTKATTSEASISTSQEVLMPAPTTPDPEFQLPKPTTSADAVTTPDPIPRAPEPTTSATNTSVDNEEGCSCAVELDALKEFGPCDPCQNAMKLTPALKSPLSSKKSSSICKKTAFCTECQMIPPTEPEFVSEVARIARTAGIFEKQLMETTSTETDTDESHLNTISERTEATSVSPIERTQLTIQHLPQIDIRPPLVVQKVFEIEIKSTGSVNKQIPNIDNVCYEEVVHSGASRDDLPMVMLEEFMKNKEDYKTVMEENSVKVIEPNISIKDTKSGAMQKRVSQTSSCDNGEKKSCLKEYDYDKLMNMKPIKSNVSFKGETLIVLDSKPSTPSTGTDAKPVFQKTESKTIDLFSLPEENKENEDLEKKEDETPTPVEVHKDSSGIIKDIKEVTLQHPDSTLMLVSPVTSAAIPVKVTKSKNFTDVLELTDEPSPSSGDEVTKKCGCDKDEGSHISDELEVDESLNQICDCYDTSLNDIGSHISAETKKSLQEIHRMETVLNKLVSDKALAESAPTDDYKLLDNHKYEQENEDEDEQPEEKPEKEEDKEQPEICNLELKPVFQAPSENESIANHKFAEKLATEENIDKPNEDEVTEDAVTEDPVTEDTQKPEEEIENNPNVGAVPKESTTSKGISESKENKSTKSVKSEKGTPLFTEDPSFPSQNKGVPKSVSQYFSSTEVSIADEEEAENQNAKPSAIPRLSILSDSLKKPLTSVQSTSEKDSYDAVGGVLQILQVDPNERPQEECNCVCRRPQASMARIVATHSASNPPSPKSSTRRSFTKSFPKFRRAEKRPSEPASPVISLQHVPTSDGGSLTPSMIKGKIRTNAIAKRVPNPSAVARKTSFNLADRVVLPGSESNDHRLSGAESEESIYVLTHDVSVQVSLDTIDRRTSSLSVTRSEKKLPRVKISVQDGVDEERKSNNYSKRKHKVNSKDQYQQSQSNVTEAENQEGTESADVALDKEKEGSDVTHDAEKECTDVTQDTEKESTDVTENTDKECTDVSQDTEKECTDATPEADDSPPQTVILQPVIVHYETKGVQKSLEDWCCPPVKLHKLRRCNDLETSSTTDTDTDKSSFKNAPAGDMPTVSEFMPYSPIRRADAQREDDELSSLGGCRNMRVFKSPKHCYSTSSSDTVDSRLEETLSEGEIKCRCSVSIGELHICRLAKDIKARAAYLKKHPDVLVKREYPGEDVRLLKQRTFYDNWVAIYASKMPPTNTSSSSDTGDRSTET